MEGESEGKRFAWHRVIVGVLVIGVLFGVWYFFLSYEDCQSQECFDKNLEVCDRAYFVSGSDMIFSYKIKGSGGNECEVEVELLQGDLNNEDSAKLEGQSMTCMLPLGAVVEPESDIGVCHGLLKEGLQDLVIKKLHTYLVQNLGRLNLEMAGLPSVN